MSASAVRAGELVGQRLGKFQILALIAMGGTAEIYLARIDGEAGFEKYLVVKCLLDHLADEQEFVRMFLDEARLGAQLDHSNIVQTLELGQHESRYYMVMEYLAGMSLAQMARKAQERVPGGLIPPDLVLGLAAQTCAGLHYAHERTVDGRDLNLVHRDISPQNLVVTFEGVLKIVDFGIAKSDVRQTNTRTGTIKGKFAYMSPEQCLAQDLDRRTDIFALGTLCHELLTGRRLFKRSNTYDTYQAIVNGRSLPPPSRLNPKLDERLDAVIMKALAYEREDRYPSAEAFGEALLGTLHARGTSVGAGDVARFVEQYFASELEEHGERMRELISGHLPPAREGTWDDEFMEDGSGSASGADAAPGETRALGHAAPEATGLLDEADLIEPSEVSLDAAGRIEPSEAAFAPIEPSEGLEDELVDDFDGDEGPTRVELNPAERVASFHRQSTSQVLRRPTTEPEQRRSPDDIPTAAARSSAKPRSPTLLGTGADLPVPPPAARPISQPPPPPASGSVAPLRTPPPAASVEPPPEVAPGAAYGYPTTTGPATSEGAVARPPLWLPAAVFVACAGVGVGATLLVARLLS